MVLNTIRMFKALVLKNLTNQIPSTDQGLYLRYLNSIHITMGYSDVLK